MKIRTRLYLLSLASVILMAVVGLITFHALGQINRQIEVEIQVGNITRGLSELSLISHEYLRYHEERMKEQWGLKYGSLGHLLKRLEEECIYPEQHRAIHESMGRDFKQIGFLFLEIQTVFTNRKRLMEENSPRTRIGDALIKENIIADQLIMTSRLMMSEAFRLDAVLHEEIRRGQEETNALLVFSIIGLVLLWVCISFFTFSAIIRSMKKLVKGTKIIGKGDLKHRVDIKTKDEIGELTAAFNSMTEKRQQAESALLKAHDELELRVKERTAELAKEIDERKQAQERIKHLNAVLRAIRDVNKLIVKEKDRDRLIQGTCESLLETRGYYNAWIVLLDKNRELITTAESGLGKDFQPMTDRMKLGELPDCVKRALAHPDMVETRDTLSDCTGCPLEGKYDRNGVMTCRLEHEGRVYGILTTSVPRSFVHDEEEQFLFKEVADDIAFALHAIESGEKEREAEERLMASEDRFRALFELAPDAYYLNDMKGRFIDGNSRW